MCAEPKHRDWKIRAQDILDCIAKIQSYTQGMTLEQFHEDSLRIDAVTRNLEIIGEAAGRIPLEVQEAYPDIAWLEMRGMRNIMAHDYFRVSISLLWYTIQQDLPVLAEQIQHLLE